MKSRDGLYNSGVSQHGNWLVRFYCEENIRRSKACKTKTVRDALIAGIKRQENRCYWFPDQAANVEDGPVGTFAALAQKWLDHSLTVREVSESCLSNYRCHLKHHILPVLGSRFLCDLTIKSVEEVAYLLSLPPVQKIAGHREISTTMRYVHTSGIENTASRQWSRERRKASTDPKEEPVTHPKIEPAVRSEIPEPVPAQMPIQFPTLQLVKSSQL